MKGRRFGMLALLMLSQQIAAMENKLPKAQKLRNAVVGFVNKVVEKSVFDPTKADEDDEVEDDATNDEEAGSLCKIIERQSKQLDELMKKKHEFAEIIELKKHFIKTTTQKQEFLNKIEQAISKGLQEPSAKKFNDSIEWTRLSPQDRLFTLQFCLETSCQLAPTSKETDLKNEILDYHEKPLTDHTSIEKKLFLTAIDQEITKSLQQSRTEGFRADIQWAKLSEQDRLANLQFCLETRCQLAPTSVFTAHFIKRLSSEFIMTPEQKEFLNKLDQEITKGSQKPPTGFGDNFMKWEELSQRNRLAILIFCLDAFCQRAQICKETARKNKIAERRHERLVAILKQEKEFAKMLKQNEEFLNEHTQSIIHGVLKPPKGFAPTIEWSTLSEQDLLSTLQFCLATRCQLAQIRKFTAGLQLKLAETESKKEAYEAHGIARIKWCKKQIELYEAKIEEHESAIREAEEQIKRYKAKIEEDESTIKEAEAQIKWFAANKAQHEAEIKKHKVQKEVSVKGYKKEIENYEAEITNYRAQIKECREEITGYKAHCLQRLEHSVGTLNGMKHLPLAQGMYLNLLIESATRFLRSNEQLFCCYVRKLLDKNTGSTFAPYAGDFFSKKYHYCTYDIIGRFLMSIAKKYKVAHKKKSPSAVTDAEQSIDRLAQLANNGFLFERNTHNALNKDLLAMRTTDDVKALITSMRQKGYLLNLKGNQEKKQNSPHRSKAPKNKKRILKTTKQKFSSSTPVQQVTQSLMGTSYSFVANLFNRSCKGCTQ